jgi:transposase
MKLVERHIITKSDPCWSEIDRYAFLSKKLFNLANYHYHQYFFENSQKLGFNQLYHRVSKTSDYLALPTKVSKQIIRRLEQAWISYFAAFKAWEKQPEKFLGKPKIINYKDKTKGKNLLIYSQESISKKPLKEGICHLSRSDLKMTTSRREIIAVRIVPKSSCYVIEILYERREETTDKQQITGVDLGVNNLMAVTTNQTGVAPLLVNGRPLKAINTFYNKQRSKQQAQLKGIKVIITEESYTSQSSALDRDELPKYGEEKPLFKGKRLTRGLYRMGTNQLLNADVNGAFNIIRKVIPDVIDQGIKGLPFNPLRA